MTISITEDMYGKLASFKLYPSSIIQDDFTNVKILNVGIYESFDGENLPQEHQEVYPTLPSNTPDDYRAYNYLKVRMPNGKTKVIGLPWIIDSSFSTYSNMTINVEIHGKSVDDISALQQVLLGNGFTDFAITTK